MGTCDNSCLIKFNYGNSPNFLHIDFSDLHAY